MAQFAGVMQKEQGISRGSSGRSPGKPETSRLGTRVGNTSGDHTKSRNVKVQISDGEKGHKRRLVRPVHQGAMKSHGKVRPKPRGVAKFSFGTIA